MVSFVGHVPPREVVVEETGSTNTDLIRSISSPDGRVGPGAAQWPHLSYMRALTQTSGRGRGGRSWVTPPGAALTVSFLLRPLIPLSCLPWLPLVAGVAIADAVAQLCRYSYRGWDEAWQVGMKWPNDVVAYPRAANRQREVPGWGMQRKIAGVLSELVICQDVARHDSGWIPPVRDQTCGVVLGVGVNTRQERADLPVAWASSLLTLGRDAGLEGQAPTPEALLAQIHAELSAVMDQWEADGGQMPQDAPLRRRITQRVVTLGKQVEVATPGGLVRGCAVGIDPALLLEDEQGACHRIEAGDVMSTRVSEHE